MTEARTINSCLARLTATELATLMKINDRLAAQNLERNHQWSRPQFQKEAVPALLSYSGEMYKSINPTDFNAEDMDFVQTHVRLLSGLYGILRPMDAILPYRLEMACNIRVGESKNLYAYWSQKITRQLVADLNQRQNQSDAGPPFLLNLASTEYFKCVKQKDLGFPILTINFKEHHKNSFKTVSVFSKQARGLMTRFIIKNRITQKEALKTFTQDGYRFNEMLSAPEEWIFTRSSV